MDNPGNLNQNSSFNVSNPDLQTSDILSYGPNQQAIDAINSFNLSINSAPIPADLSASIQDYYPTLNQPIQRGSSGGRSIFVGSGGVVPLTIAESRKKALENAALLRQRQIDDFNKTFSSLEGITDARFNNKIQQQFITDLNGEIAKAKTLYGRDWATGLKADPNFQKKIKSYEFIVQRNNEIINKTAEWEKGLLDGSIERAPAIEKALEAYRTERENGADPVRLINSFKDAEATIGFDKYVRDSKILDNIGYEIKESLGSFKDKGSYREAISQTIKQGKYGSVVKRLQQQFPNLDPQFIENYVIDSVDYEVKKDRDTMSKPKYEYDAEEDAKFKPAVQYYQGVNIGGKEVVAANATEVPQKLKKDGIRLSSADYVTYSPEGKIERGSIDKNVQFYPDKVMEIPDADNKPVVVVYGRAKKKYTEEDLMKTRADGSKRIHPDDIQKIGKEYEEDVAISLDNVSEMMRSNLKGTIDAFEEARRINPNFKFNRKDKTSAPPAPVEDGIPVLSDEAGYNNLPSGSYYYGENGAKYRKP